MDNAFRPKLIVLMKYLITQKKETIALCDIKGNVSFGTGDVLDWKLPHTSKIFRLAAPFPIYMIEWFTIKWL